MSKRRLAIAGLLTAVGGSSLVVTPAPVLAAVTTPTVSDLATALDVPTGVTVGGLTGDGASRAVASTAVDPNVAFDDFPSSGNSYAVLSTGDASKVFEGVPTSQLSTDLPGTDASGLTLTVAESTGAGCLFVDFAMGTEEPVHTYTTTRPSDQVSIVRTAAPGTELAQNAGVGYFIQNTDSDPAPEWGGTSVPYSANALQYWHRPGDVLDPVPGTAEQPMLPAVTGLNSLSTRDTARIPLTYSGGTDTVQVSVADANNSDLDSVAFIDHVRLGASCDAGTGVEPDPTTQLSPNSCCGFIGGVRGVGNALWYDPVPGTQTVEQYDSVANKWRSPSNVPVELRFRWYRTLPPSRNSGFMNDWVAIPNADRQAYVPTSVDRGKVLIVLVTGVVDGRRYETFPSTGTADKWYVTTAIDYGTFTDGEAPQVNDSNGGTVSAGDVLTAQIGNTVPRQDTYGWQWRARKVGNTGWSDISGANAQNYTVGEAYAGYEITVEATAVRDQFNSRTWQAPTPVGPVEYKTWQSKPKPVITHDGTPTVGEELNVSAGTWLPTPTSYSYQWKRNGNVISGATNPNYEMQAADTGESLTVDVSGVLTGYAQEKQTSAAVVPAGQVMAGATDVGITGTPRYGERLTALVGTWSPSGSSLTYAWYADTTLLKSGTGSSYQRLTIPLTAIGKRITLKVTGTKSGYTPLTVPSAPTAVVAPGVLKVGQPKVFGTAKVGKTLTASPGSWGPTGVVRSYQWYVGSKKVTGSKGRRTTLKLAKSTRGKRIKVVVTGKLAGYTTASRASAKTAKVKR